MARNIIRTHKGRTIDMGAIKAKNGHVRAAGNSKMNARGDLLGPGGKIIKTKEQLATEYNNKNPKAVDRAVSLNTPVKEMLTAKTEEKINNKVEQPVPTASPIEKPEQSTKSDIDSLKKFDLGVIVDETTTNKE